MRVDMNEVIRMLEGSPETLAIQEATEVTEATEATEAAEGSAQGIVRYAPNAVTLLGHGLTLWWLSGGPFLAGAAGLLCDDIDGWLARKLHATSKFGGLYDWATDITLCSLLLKELGVLPLAALLVPIQVWRKDRDFAVTPLASARSVLTVALFIVRGAKP